MDHADRSGVFTKVNGDRASTRALIAARPANGWIDRERGTHEANAHRVPNPDPVVQPRRGRR